MGYVPVPPPPPHRDSTILSERALRKPDAPPLNLDRFGMPRDYTTYVWLLYGRRVNDRSPQRLSFLHGPRGSRVPRPILMPSRDIR